MQAPGHPRHIARLPDVRRLFQRIRPHHRLHYAAHQRQVNPQKLAVVAGIAFRSAINMPQQRNRAAQHILIQPVNGINGVAGIDGSQRPQRVVGYGEAQIFPFLLRLFLRREVAQAGIQLQQGAAGAAVHLLSEHTELARIAAPRFLLRHIPDAVQSVNDGGAGRQGIKGPRPGQGFQGAPVEAGNIGPAAEIADGRIRPFGRPFRHNGLHRPLAHGLDRRQSHAQGVLRPPAGLVGGVQHTGSVDIRQPDANAHPVAFVDRRHIAVAVIQPAVEHRRHIFQRIMPLEVRRPVGNQAVADAVRLVEGVTGKGLNQAENLRAHLLRVALLHRPGHKPRAFLRHQLGDLLAHRLPHGVRLPQRIAGEVLQNVQHLVLIDNDPVGFIQQLFHAGMGVGNLLPAVLGADKAVDMLHGAGPVQGDHRRNIAQIRRLQLLDVPLHPGAFQLKQVGSVARPQQFVGRLIIQSQPAQVNADAPFLVQQLDGAIQDG